jgi:hypothetical protein
LLTGILFHFFMLFSFCHHLRKFPEKYEFVFTPSLCILTKAQTVLKSLIKDDSDSSKRGMLAISILDNLSILHFTEFL